jgi:hypothetical protein
MELKWFGPIEDTDAIRAKFFLENCPCIFFKNQTSLVRSNFILVPSEMKEKFRKRLDKNEKQTKNRTKKKKEISEQESTKGGTITSGKQNSTPKTRVSINIRSLANPVLPSPPRHPSMPPGPPGPPGPFGSPGPLSQCRPGSLALLARLAHRANLGLACLVH